LNEKKKHRNLQVLGIAPGVVRRPSSVVSGQFSERKVIVRPFNNPLLTCGTYFESIIEIKYGGTKL